MESAALRTDFFFLWKCHEDVMDRLRQKLLIGKPEQYPLHGFAKVDKNPDKAPRPCEIYRLLQCGIGFAGFPLASSARARNARISIL